MAKKKYKTKDIEILAAWIAQGPDRFELLDFAGKTRDVYEDLTNENPLIKGYEWNGVNFLNKLMRSDDVSGADKKLLLEASAYGLGDVKSYLPRLFNNIDEETRNEVFGDINKKSVIEEGTGIDFPGTSWYAHDVDVLANFGSSFHYLDSPSTTSATTYKVQALVQDASYSTILNNFNQSYITVMEVLA